MKKILWFSSVNELDYEMQMLFDRMPDYDFRMAVPSAGNDYFFPVPIRLDHTSIVTKEQMVALLRDYQPDLLIHRYRRDHVPILEAAEETGVPVLIWVTEQGPDRDIEWDRNQYFRNLAANNPWDVDYFKSRGVENVYYWPFGFLPFFHCPVEPDEKYRCDFVGYGNPIYNWYDCKRESVDNVVVPLVKNGYDVSLWGRRSGESGGWLDVPGVIDGKHYKGTFNYDDLSKVNASAKVILGITSNGRYGAFGSRLARALGSKAFCIWAYSEGMEEMSEGFANHRNCCWSTHPDETLEIADFYLKNDAARLRVAEAGQKMAFEKLNYFDMVPPIIEDMIGKQPRRAHSRYYALSRAIGKAIAERQPQRVLECGYQILADDVTSLNYAMALDMAESFLELRKYRLCLEYLRIFRDKYAAWERRLGRSAQRFPVDSRIDALLRRIIQVIGDRLDEGTGGEDWDELRHLLIGVLGIHSGGDLAGPLFTQLARYMVTASYRDGNGATALQAFNIYLALLEDSKHERNNALAISRGLLACFPRGNGKKRAAAAPVDLISQWELLVRVSSHLDLLRANLLVGGDILPGQP
ncbi:MAG: hypothetical protein FJX76_26500, partial [Armatimonadetes bacterium]|nr:hypothetical protein [Armatimonadota bacterium]